MVAQLKLPDLSSIYRTTVAQLFLGEPAFFTRRQQLLPERLGNFIGQFAHSGIVAIPSQSVYSKLQGWYFRYPVYTPTAFGN